MAFFIGYGIAALSLWGMQRWPFRVALFAGLSAVFPFATVWFERWAGRHGYLTVKAGQAASGRGAGPPASSRGRILQAIVGLRHTDTPI